ncbi:hypothetical protein ACTQ49_13540 [Luteococcus sp. Sow4_B9]|uniref:hypothetical protein n=1 Tax=Luteococcus sp. Sow4_B9 TaxID=3438792 RepID=UPI003F9EA7A2
MKKTPILWAGLASAVAPAVVTAPRAEKARERDAINRIVQHCRTSGLSGWELVDEASRQVHAAYTHHSLWHLWETPTASLERGRGWSAQYNGALALVLRELGFEVQEVHASRVRGLGRNPWWQAGHTWLRVTHQGRTLDVSASSAQNIAGNVDFVPTSVVRPTRRWTRSAVSVALAPIVAVQAWRQLRGAQTPRWLYRDFDQPL